MEDLEESRPLNEPDKWEREMAELIIYLYFTIFDWYLITHIQTTAASPADFLYDPRFKNLNLFGSVSSIMPPCKLKYFIIYASSPYLVSAMGDCPINSIESSV